ncbi:hypothetical protein [Sphingomonas sp.]|uniref:hypothetical protein n=1 Tax=Sphingomonas sp. TaxID=28214 RepID=UPI00286E2FB6|nr:hypothetical protein [Sphingomonas sp.]
MTRLIGLVGLALVASSCSQDTAAPGNTSQPSTANAASTACDVLTAADATAALGREVKRLPNDGGPAGLDICQYGYSGARLADGGQVSVTVQPVDIATAIASAKAQGYELEPIAGLGDEAYYSREFGLYVGKGERTAIYLLGAGGLKDAKERSLALARATEGRL